MRSASDQARHSQSLIEDGFAFFHKRAHPLFGIRGVTIGEDGCGLISHGFIKCFGFMPDNKGVLLGSQAVAVRFAGYARIN